MTAPGLRQGEALPEYRVRAHNASVHSANKIHDDEVAKQYGFAGGLVPGVTVYAYMTVPVVQALGEAWIARGHMDARFLKPFYEGETVTVRATVREQDAAGVTLDLLALNDAGETCATGSAGKSESPPLPPEAGQWPDIPLFRPALAPTPAVLQGVAALGSLHEHFDGGQATAAYLEEVADSLPTWRGEGAPAHPAYLLRRANSVLSDNVALGPWIHVSSDVQHFAAVHDADELITRANVTGVWERKGHQFIRLDVLLLSRGWPVMRVEHTAIYDVRRAT